MTKETLLMQYQSECLSALKSVANIHKPFEKAFMDTMKLFMAIGVIDIDHHECMTLGSIQTPECKTLDNMDKNLVDWYSSYLISRKDKLQNISRTVVADAFFSKETFITPMCENNFHVISRFRNDVVLYYPTLEKKTVRPGHPKWFDGRIDFANLDLTRCKEYEVNKGQVFHTQCLYA